MNKQTGNHRTDGSRENVRLIACSLHVSETVSIPIKQKVPEQNPAGQAETDPVRGKPARVIFIAPTFAEMMRDKQILEATLRAIAAGENIVAPWSKGRHGNYRGRVQLKDGGLAVIAASQGEEA